MNASSAAISSPSASAASVRRAHASPSLSARSKAHTAARNFAPTPSRGSGGRERAPARIRGQSGAPTEIGATSMASSLRRSSASAAGVASTARRRNAPASSTGAVRTSASAMARAASARGAESSSVS
jgi:hypothetical protein